MNWNDAINAGRVRVAEPNPLSEFSAQQFYAGQIGIDMFGTPVADIASAENIQLTPDFFVQDPSLDGHESLVMSWDNSSGDQSDILNVAAWEYVYDVDPDLTSTRIDFSILAPLGVWDFSLELIDANGFSRGWFGTPPNNLWSNFSVRPDIAAAQGPFLSFIDQPGFDITQVLIIRLNESSQGGVSFIDNPALIGSSITPWNAWNSLAVVAVPEPSSFVLLGIGTIGLVFMRRRQRKSKLVA